MPKVPMPIRSWKEQDRPAERKGRPRWTTSRKRFRPPYQSLQLALCSLLPNFS